MKNALMFMLWLVLLGGCTPGKPSRQQIDKDVHEHLADSVCCHRGEHGHVESVEIIGVEQRDTEAIASVQARRVCRCKFKDCAPYCTTTVEGVVKLGYKKLDTGWRLDNIDGYSIKR